MTNTHTSPPAASGSFPLLWAVAMSGHRELANEDTVRQAVKEKLAGLKAQAAAANAGLTAVSSIARGADLIFAEECLAAGLPWKCLLPFAKVEFKKDGFSEDEWARAEACMARAYRVEVLHASLHLAPSIRPADRNEAYLQCGYRTVEVSDAVMLVLDPQHVGGTGGAAEIKTYAEALDRPAWILNPVTGHAEDHITALFRSSEMPLIKDAAALPDPGVQPWEKIDTSPRSATQLNLELLFRQVDSLALKKQGDAQTLMQSVVLFHLFATAAAALSVTVLATSYRKQFHPDSSLLVTLLGLLFAMLVLAKPVFAWLALRREKKLHEHHSQQHWVEARVAAELCRSAATCWRFPVTPSAFSEEDFPHFQRLIRTLRMAREMDHPPIDLPAGMDPFHLYDTFRVDEQIDYFKGKHRKAIAEHGKWQRRFNFATWTVIILGLLFGIAEAISEGCECFGPKPEHGEHHAGWVEWLHFIGPFISFVLIVAPFYASYALAMLSIQDCHRRSERYQTLEKFLTGQKSRISKVKTPASRLATVENTERMLLEELHEWYSVMKAVRV